MKREDLLNSKGLRYRGRNVGIIGYVPDFGTNAFIWWQDYFRSKGGGYAMSEGLVDVLESEDVELVYVKECDDLTSLETITQSTLVDPWDPVFDNCSQRPRESQYLYKPDE